MKKIGTSIQYQTVIVVVFFGVSIIYDKIDTSIQF